MQNACMPSITIRHVPAATHDALATRAARAGQSLQEYLLGELERLASSPTLDDWIERVASLQPDTRQPTRAEIVAWIDAGRTER